MRRTTVFLEDALLRQARARARREGKSFAAVVREAIERYLSDAGSSRSLKLPTLTGRFASGHADTAETADTLLWKDPHA
jgi:hypothetical protein